MDMTQRSRVRTTTIFLRFWVDGRNFKFHFSDPEMAQLWPGTPIMAYWYGYVQICGDGEEAKNSESSMCKTGHLPRPPITLVPGVQQSYTRNCTPMCISHSHT